MSRIYLKTLKVLILAVADGTTASTKDNVAFIIRNPAGVNVFSTSASGPCPEPPYTLVLAVDEDSNARLAGVHRRYP